MIRHVAVFRFVPEFTSDQREHWMSLLRALPDQIPELRSMSVGPDALGGPASHEIAIVADFDDLDGLMPTRGIPPTPRCSGSRHR